ncbi:MAG TPA: HlyD family secretion protein [Vicinamibacterales bacterium]|jgi:membrane fusion protein (multidrug efflux system)|nr:HlyD family secretion protein [Vicinamibacterales bacterium]
MADNTEVLDDIDIDIDDDELTRRVRAADPTGNSQPASRKSPLRLIVLLLAVGVAVTGAVIWWIHTGTYESTDDAQVNAHLSAISSRVAGTVTAVYVEENQFVKQGQVIAELDPRDFQNALDQAQSQLRQTEAQVQAINPNVPITETSNRATVSATEADLANAAAAVSAAERDSDAAEADLRQAEANAAKAQADVARYEPLVAKEEVPREQYDQVVATAKAQAALVDARRASAAAARKTVDQRNAVLTQMQARLTEAKSNAPLQLAIRRADIVTRQAGVTTAATQVERAQLDLSYTKVVAPVSGIVSRRTVEVGQHVSAGQQMVQIAQIGDVWVTANFKETQLRRMRPGQRVTIHVDAFAQDLDGHLESLPASTGAITSLLPPENATGNYVKVIQRLPVRIRFQPGQSGLDRLRPGMSVDPKVWVE